ncbi:hypothetical protein JKP88DRAFT_129306, partial [Tribonema minus]
ITGGPGTGKTHVLNTMVGMLPEGAVRVCATTGCAANNIDGDTAHSMFHIGVRGRNNDGRLTGRHLAAMQAESTNTYLIAMDEAGMASLDFTGRASIHTEQARQGDELRVRGPISISRHMDQQQLPAVGGNS